MCVSVLNIFAYSLNVFYVYVSVSDVCKEIYLGILCCRQDRKKGWNGGTNRRDSDCKDLPLGMG